MTKLPYVVFSALLIASCGGSSQRSQGTPPAAELAPGAVTQKQVVYTTTANGCLLTNNADSNTQFLLGDKPARYLAWQCADHGDHQLRQVRVLFAYDFNQSCFTERLTVVDFARCTGTIAAPPTNPFIAVSVAGFGATPATNAQGLPGYDCVATLNNAGNIPAFNIGYEIRETGGSPITAGTLNVIEPQSSVTLDQCDAFGATLRGKRFTLELQLSDVFGQPLLARPAATAVTIP